MFFGVLHGKDDEVDVIHRQAHRRADLETVIHTGLTRDGAGAATDHPKFLHIPFAGRHGIFAQQMYVPKMMVIGGIQLDQLVVWPIDIGEEENPLGIAAPDVADVRQRGRKFCAAIKLLLIGLFHVLRAPADVPDGRGDFGLGRLVGLGK